MVNAIIEQRIVVKFHMKLGKTATETYILLKQVYGNKCLSRARVFKWFKRFQEGREDVEDDARPGRPATSKTDENIKKIGNLIRSDRRLSIRAIAETVGIDKECVRQILGLYEFNNEDDVGKDQKTISTSANGVSGINIKRRKEDVAEEHAANSEYEDKPIKREREENDTEDTVSLDNESNDGDFE